MALTLSVDDFDCQLVSKFYIGATTVLDRSYSEISVRHISQFDGTDTSSTERFSLLNVLDLFLPLSLLEKLHHDLKRVLTKRH